MVDSTSAAGTPKPRPKPGPRSEDSHDRAGRDPQTDIAAVGRNRPTGRTSTRTRSRSRAVAVPDPQSTQLVTTAGSALVTAARVGRLLGRSGWRAARSLPGVALVEAQSRKLRNAARDEVLRLLDAPQPGPSREELRAARLAARGVGQSAPLRSAMHELLDRSSEASGAQSRDYLFGTIVSQLVPDEARILATLGTGRMFAVIDVMAKGRSVSRPVAANLSTVGVAAGVSLPDNVGTYLTRLDGYGLLSFGRSADDLEREYRTLEHDKQTRAAQARIERGRMGSVKIVRKSITLSELGHELWAACAPRR